MKFFFRIFLLIAAVLLLGQMVERAQAQTPLTIVVGYSAGGGSDVAVRRIAQALNESLNTSVIVENRPGGSGVIAALRVRDARANEKVVLFGDPRVLFTNWKSLSQVPYSVEDFKYGSVFLKAPFVLVAHRNLKERIGSVDVESLTKYAKDHPEELHFLTAGINSPHHMLLKEIERSLQVSFNHIPMQGDALSIQELLSGRARLAIVAPLSVQVHLSNPDILPIAMIWDTPLKDTPFESLPTLSDWGIKDVVNNTLMAWVYAKDTPEDFIQKFDALTQRIVSEPTMRQALTEIGFVPYSIDRLETYSLIMEASK